MIKKTNGRNAKSVNGVSKRKQRKKKIGNGKNSSTTEIGFVMRGSTPPLNEIKAF